MQIPIEDTSTYTKEIPEGFRCMLHYRIANSIGAGLDIVEAMRVCISIIAQWHHMLTCECETAEPSCHVMHETRQDEQRLVSVDDSAIHGCILDGGDPASTGCSKCK